HLIVDIDASETTIVCAQNGLPLFCRALPYGLDKLQPQGESADPLPELHQFFREIARVLLSFQQLQDLPLLFTGQVVENPALISLLSEFLKRPLAPESPLPSNIRLAKPYTYQEICRFAACLGTALSYLLLQKEMQSVNFRKYELAFTDKWLRWKKELVVYFSLIVLIGATWLAIGKMQLEKGRKTLVVQYAELLASIEKPPQKVEEEYAKSRGDDVPADVDITSLSAEEIQDRLFFLEKEFTTTQEDLALHPDVPRVTDVLAWLSTHPKVQGENGEGLKLENLHYLMVKRPEKGKMKERYSIRVELEFSSPNPTQAREFHDALLSPNPFVDAKSELKWSVQKDRYRASFILKDRTQYPHSIAQGELHAGN
ncbi:MAG: hypothetical protein JSR46_08990, partial [Verrucomicrobia bacterium]|nr:hypothetical protein [Verrucomicrobiota bacterium]